MKMTNKHLLIAIFSIALVGCGGGGGIDGSGGTSTTGSNATTLVNVTCTDGTIVKGSDANDVSKCPSAKVAAKLTSKTPGDQAQSSTDVVSATFDKRLKSESAKCTISPTIPDTKCEVSYSSDLKTISVQGSNGEKLFYPSKNIDTYSVNISSIYDQDNLKLPDISITFKSFNPTQVKTKNGFNLATSDYLINNCKEAFLMNSNHWNQCLLGQSFTGTTDILKGEYCEVAIGLDGSFKYFSASGNFTTTGSDYYLKSDEVYNNYTFKKNTETDNFGPYLIGSTSILTHSGTGNEFDIYLKIFSKRYQNMFKNYEKSELIFTNKTSTGKRVETKRACYINSIE
jgi:hypothetical protein